METNPDQPYLEELRTTDFQPIFILGVHRSGTSILYKMLTATDCFNAVTAYHLIKYNELLSNHYHGQEHHVKQELTDSFKQGGLETRKIDSLRLTADFAEEYGFLLAKKTIELHLTPKNIDLFKDLCKKIQVLAGNDKPILLKNPYDFSNFLYLKQMFPKAKFIFIHRHPFKTISSARKAIEMVFQSKNQYLTNLLYGFYKKMYHPVVFLPFRVVFSKVPDMGVLVLTRMTTNATTYYLKNISKLPGNDYCIITYEEFCEHTQQTIQIIMDTLSLPFTTRVDMELLMNPRKTTVDPSVRKWKRFIYWSMKQYFDRFGYTIEGE